MSRDLGLADRLRAADLEVIEVAGWQTRGGDTFAPRGSVNHHTAGAPPSAGVAPSLAVIIYGRKGLAGPLAQVYQDRRNRIFVVASGRANHAGRGGYAGMTGNSSVLGLEVENVGTRAEPWRPDQIATMAKAHAAMIAPHGAHPGRVCQHREWAPTRKIDAHSLDVDRFRGLVLLELVGEAGHPPAPTQPAPVPPASSPLGQILRVIADVSTRTQRPGDRGGDVEVLQRVLNHKAGQGLAVDGIYGPATEAAVRNVQAWVGLAVDGIAGPNTWHALKQ